MAEKTVQQAIEEANKLPISGFVHGLVEFQSAASERRKQADERSWAIEFIAQRQWQNLTDDEHKIEMRKLGRIMDENDIQTDCQPAENARIQWRRLQHEMQEYHDLASLIWFAMDDITEKAAMQGNIRQDNEASDASGIEQIKVIIFDFFDKETAG